MSSSTRTRTVNGVGTVTTNGPVVTKASVSQIIDLVSDDEDSENDDAFHGISRDTSRGMPHHQNAVPQELDEALNENESNSEVELDGDEEEDGSDDDDNSSMENLIDDLTDENIYDNRKFIFTS